MPEKDQYGNLISPENLSQAFANIENPLTLETPKTKDPFVLEDQGQLSPSEIAAKKKAEKLNFVGKIVAKPLVTPKKETPKNVLFNTEILNKRIDLLTQDAVKRATQGQALDDAAYQQVYGTVRSQIADKVEKARQAQIDNWANSTKNDYFIAKSGLDKFGNAQSILGIAKTADLRQAYDTYRGSGDPFGLMAGERNRILALKKEELSKTLPPEEVEKELANYIFDKTKDEGKRKALNLGKYFDEQGEPTAQFKRDVFEIAQGDPSKFKKAAEDLIQYEHGAWEQSPTKNQQESKEFENWLAKKAGGAPYAVYRFHKARTKGTAATVAEFYGGVKSMLQGKTYAEGEHQMRKTVDFLDPGVHQMADKNEVGLINSMLGNVGNTVGEIIGGTRVMGGSSSAASNALKGVKEVTKDAAITTAVREGVKKGVAGLANTAANRSYIALNQALNTASAAKVAKYADDLIGVTRSMGIQAYDGYLEDALSKGYSYKEAQDIAAKRTATNLPIEALFMPLLNKTKSVLFKEAPNSARMLNPVSESMKQSALQVGKVASGEAGEEIAQNLFDKYYDYSEAKQRGELAEDAPFDWKDAALSSLEDGATGFLAGVALSLIGGHGNLPSSTQSNLIAHAIQDPKSFTAQLERDLAKGRISQREARMLNGLVGRVAPTVQEQIEKGASPEVAVKYAIESERLKETAQQLTAETDPVKIQALQNKVAASALAIQQLQEGTYLRGRTVSGTELAELSERFTPAASLSMEQTGKILKNAPYKVETIDITEYANDPEISALVQQQQNGGIPVENNGEIVNFQPQNTNPVIISNEEVIDGKKRIAYNLANGVTEMEVARPIKGKEMAQMVEDEFESTLGSGEVNLEGLSGDIALEAERARRVFDSLMDNELSEAELAQAEDMDLGDSPEQSAKVARATFAAAQHLLDAGLTEQEIKETLPKIVGYDLSEPMSEWFANKAVISKEAGLRIELPKPAEEVIQNEPKPAPIAVSRGTINVNVPSGLMKKKGWSEKGLHQFRASLAKAFGDDVAIVVVDNKGAAQILKEKGIGEFTPEQTPSAWATPSDNVIYINVDQASFGKPLHEAAHLWTAWAKVNAPQLYAKGMELAKSTAEYRWVMDLISDPSAPKPEGISDERADKYRNYGDRYAGKTGASEIIADEILAYSVEQEGNNLAGKEKSTFLKWLGELFTTIKNSLGFQNMSVKDFARMSLADFSKKLAKEITSGDLSTTFNVPASVNYTAKSGNQIVRVNEKGELEVIDTKTNQPASDTTRRRAIKEAIENFDYTVGEIAPEPSDNFDGNYYEWVAENSNNPAELASVYLNDEATSDLTVVEQHILDNGVGFTTGESFARFADRNLMTPEIRRNYIRAKKKPGEKDKPRSLDVLAQDLSTEEIEVTVQDLVDFILKFPNPANAESQRSRAAYTAAERFTQITGFPLNDKIAYIAVKNYAETQLQNENATQEESELEGLIPQGASEVSPEAYEGEGEGSQNTNELIEEAPFGFEEKPLAPNGKPSKLTPEQHAQVRTPQFKKWFGDWESDPHGASKIVDENGEPMVVYHRTNNDFFTFDKRETMSGAFYFSPFRFQGDFKNLVPAFLNIRNYITTATNFTSNVSNKYNEFEFSENNLKESGVDGVVGTKIFDDLIKINKDTAAVEFDPAKVMDRTLYLSQLPIASLGDGVDEIVAFDPNQIKSATNNNGEFDVANDDTRFGFEEAQPSDDTRFALSAQQQSAQANPANTATPSAPFVYADTTNAMPVRKGLRQFLIDNVVSMFGNSEQYKREYEKALGTANLLQTENIKLYDKAIKRIKELVNSGSLPANIDAATMNKVFSGALQGEVDSRGISYMTMLPLELQEIVTAMRDRIDAASDQLMRSGWTKRSLAEQIAKNQGSYLTRSYKAFQPLGRKYAWLPSFLPFNKRKWIDEIPAHVKETAHKNMAEYALSGGIDAQVGKTFKEYASLDPVLEQLAPQGHIAALESRIANVSGQLKKNYETLLDAAYQTSEEYLKGLIDDSGKFVTTSGGVKIKMAEFKERKDLPEWLREYLGEIEDPANAFLVTMNKLNRANVANEMLGNTLQLGLNSGDILPPNAVNVPEEYIRVGSSESDAKGEFNTWGALNGHWIHPDLYKMLYQVPADANWWYKNVTVPIKAGKTKWSPVSIVKNLVSNYGFLAANGTFVEMIVNAPSITKAVSAQSKAKGWQYFTDLYNNGMRENVANSMGADEFKQMMGKIGGDNSISDAFKKNPLQAFFEMAKQAQFAEAGKELGRGAANTFGVFDNLASKAFAMGDIIPKLLAFEVYRNGYAQRVYGKSYYELNPREQLAINGAAGSQVKNTMPTQSRVAKGIMSVQRKVPVLGTFASFMYESWRNLANNAMHSVGVNDNFEGLTFDDDPKVNEQIKKKLIRATQRNTIAGLALWSNLMFQLFGVAMLMFGDDDETEETLDNLWIFNPKENLGYQTVKQIRNRGEMTTEDAIRMFVPSYSKNSMLIVNPQKDGTYEIIDKGSYEPFNVVAQIGRGTLYDGVPGTAQALLEGTVAPVAGPEMLSSAVVHLAFNRDENDRKIYNKDREEYVTQAIMPYLTKKVAPGAIVTAMGMHKAMTEYDASLGEALGDVGQAMTYGRPNKLDPMRASKTMLSRLKEELNEAQGSIQRDFYKKDADAQALTEEQFRIWKRKATQMNEVIRAARVLGVSEDELKGSLKELRVSRRIKSAIIIGGDQIQKITPTQLKEPEE